MRERTRTVEMQMEAEASAIWDYRLDFMNLSAYNPNVHGLERISESGPDGTGARYRFELDSPTGPHRVELRVTRTLPDRLVAIEMDGVLPAREELTITPTEGKDGGAQSMVTIALTLLIPDHFPEASDDALVDSGTGQVRAELDAMAARLEVHDG